jgi:RNA polymerase sigma-70 factor (ECF subfamily)
MITTTQYNEAVKAYTKNIFRFLMKSLRDDDAASDIVQDCYMKLWLHRKKVDEKKVKSWLFAVAHNAMINYMKSEARKRTLDNTNHEEHVYQSQQFDIKPIIDRALNELPDIQKSIILLRDLEGYRYDEIADILSISESHVKVYLFRARVKIKNMLKSLMHVL